MIALETGSGTPLVLIHGFTLDHGSLLPLVQVVERAGGWRRVHLDLPWAAGARGGGEGGTQEVADAVVAEIRAHLGDEPFAVLGNSFGGMIARHVAHELRPQVLGLATLAGVFVAAHADRELPKRTVLHEDPAVVPLLGDALAGYREGAVVESVDDACAFLEHVLPGIESADPVVLERIQARYALDREPEDAHPEPFTAPTLHLAGRQDEMVGYADAWRRIEHYPRATFAVLDGAGHGVLGERSGLCAALLVDWLERMRHLA